MKRREFLSRSATAGLSLGILSACGGGDDSNSPDNGNTGQPGSGTPNAPQMPAYDGPDPFQHGVASGDHGIAKDRALDGDGVASAASSASPLRPSASKNAASSSPNSAAH